MQTNTKRQSVPKFEKKKKRKDCPLTDNFKYSTLERWRRRTEASGKCFQEWAIVKVRFSFPHRKQRGGGDRRRRWAEEVGGVGGCRFGGGRGGDRGGGPLFKRGRLMTDRHSASGKVFDRKQVVCPVTDGSSCQSQSAFKGITTNEKKKNYEGQKTFSFYIFKKEKRNRIYLYNSWSYGKYWSKTRTRIVDVVIKDVHLKSNWWHIVTWKSIIKVWSRW